LTGFSLLDWLTLIFFGLAWFGYEFVVDRTAVRHRSLNRAIDAERHHWMQEMALVDNRIMDSNLQASLQNGTAFFASTSLLAVGAALTLLRATDDVLTILAEVPFGLATSRIAWEVKVSGLVIIFVYAFFKFAWSYRLFNYTAVLIGSVPRPGSPRGRDPQAAAERAASMNVVAAFHFNRGQRAFFFALAYLGWFVSGYVLIISTVVIFLRDLKHVLPILLQLGIFATPVAYPMSKIPADVQVLYSIINPLAPIIDGYRRTVLYGLPPEWHLLGPATVTSLILLVGGYLFFKRMEADFADAA